MARVTTLVALAASATCAQPVAAARDPGKEIQERALYSERDSRAKVPLSITMSFLPSAHPESKVVIRFYNSEQAEIELIQPSVASGTVLQKVRRTGSVDIQAAVAMMSVKRKRLPVDPKTASAWLEDFGAALAASLDTMKKQSLGL